MKLFALLFTGMLVASAAYAVDYEKYCLKYLNGELKPLPADASVEGQELSVEDQARLRQNEMIAGIKFKQDEIYIQGMKQKTITADLSVLGGTSKKIKTTYDIKNKLETQSISVYGKDGKKVDYTLNIVRGLDGSLKEIVKKEGFFSFKVPQRLVFSNKNDICIPDEYKKNFKLMFDTTLCRELHDFYTKNPNAKECMTSKYDEQVMAIVSKHDKRFKPIKESTSTLAAKASNYHVDACDTEGLTTIVLDESVWGTASSASPVTTTNETLPTVDDGSGVVEQ